MYVFLVCSLIFFYTGDHTACFRYDGESIQCYKEPPCWNEPTTTISQEAAAILLSFMTSPKLLKDFKYFTDNIETSGLESFNNTRSRYLDKKKNWPNYDVRMLCPWMDWNENCHRLVMSEYDCHTRDNKRSHKYNTHRTIQEPKTYSFRYDIIRHVFPDVKW